MRQETSKFFVLFVLLRRASYKYFNAWKTYQIIPTCDGLWQQQAEQLALGVWREQPLSQLAFVLFR